jgi:acyl-CoA synthetase (NDP forming)
VYPVNPRADRESKGVAALPEAFLDVPAEDDLSLHRGSRRRHVLAVARECAEKRVRGLVVISAGSPRPGARGRNANAISSRCVAHPACG